MGCGGKNGYGCGSCGDCHGNYGEIASGFSSVPDNYNSVTNFVPKNPAFRSLIVCGKAVENTASRRRRHSSSSKDCCDTGSEDWKNSCVGGACGDDVCTNFGFGANNQFPPDIRPESVTVFGKVKCTCTKGMLDMDGKCGGRCHRDYADGEGLGFVQWPPIGYAKSVRACGPIIKDAGCKKHKHGKRCHNVADCGSSSGSSSFSSTKSSSFSSRSRRHRHHHKSSSSSSSCGCGH